MLTPDLTAAYGAWLRARGYSVATQKASLIWVEDLGRWREDVLGLNAAELLAYQKELRWRPNRRGSLYAENSVNQAVEAIRRFYRWALAEGFVRKDPTEKLVTTRPPPKGRLEMTPSQGRKLLATAEPFTFVGCRNRTILGLALETRASGKALARLDLEHFCADTGALLLVGRCREIVSLSEGLLDDCCRYLREGRAGTAKDEEKAFFVGCHGRRLGPENFGVIIRRSAKLAGVPSPLSFSP